MVKKAKKNNAAGPGRNPTGLSISRAGSRSGSGPQKSVAPRVASNSNGIVISRSEMAGTVTNGATLGFAVTPASLGSPGYDISPTNGFLFPWLSTVAGAYEKYRFRRLTFRAVSGQPSTAVGRLYMGADPDWDDDVPTTKAALMGLAISSDSPCWEKASLTIPIRTFTEGTEWRYCTPSRRVSTSEPRLGFVGFLVVGVDTPTANLVWDLWIDYEVELTLPTAENLAPSETTVVGDLIPFAAGTDGKFYNFPAYPNPSGPLSSVSTTLANLTGSSMAGVPLTQAIVLPQEGTGYLDFTKYVALAGSTPSALATAKTVEQQQWAYDGRGAFLGNLTAAAGANCSVGPASVAADTAGSNLLVRSGIFMKDLLAYYPTAKYVVDMLKTAAALTPTSYLAAAKLVL